MMVNILTIFILFKLDKTLIFLQRWMTARPTQKMPAQG